MALMAGMNATARGIPAESDPATGVHDVNRQLLHERRNGEIAQEAYIEPSAYSQTGRQLSRGHDGRQAMRRLEAEMQEAGPAADQEPASCS